MKLTDPLTEIEIAELISCTNMIHPEIAMIARRLAFDYDQHLNKMQELHEILQGQRRELDDKDQRLALITDELTKLKLS